MVCWKALAAPYASQPIIPPPFPPIPMAARTCCASGVLLPFPPPPAPHGAHLLHLWRVVVRRLRGDPGHVPRVGQAASRQAGQVDLRSKV